MRNLYELLGINEKATDADIKKAYRRLALTAHPDKPGGDETTMKWLNEAFTTLSDPITRKTFDESWDAFSGSNLEETRESVLTDHLSAGSSRPYSEKYRQEHTSMISRYTQQPLSQQVFSVLSSEFCPPVSNLSAIEALLTLPISPGRASQLLIACLSGGYHDEARVIKLKKYLSSHLTAQNLRAPEHSFYEGINDILFMLSKPPQQQVQLIDAIKKITDFAKQASGTTLLELIPLFYNPFFRQLFNHALNVYWHQTHLLFQDNPRLFFDGYLDTKEFLQVLRERLSVEPDEHLSALIKNMRLLYRFEKDLHEAGEKAQTAAEFRDMAFHTLDWLPVMMERHSEPLLLNLFLQIGILLQHASSLEFNPAIRMADEQLALKIHLTAVSFAKETTPDIALYADTQVIRYLSAFQFTQQGQDDIMSALKNRVFMTIDMFPFFEKPKSNIALFRQEGSSLGLMRQLLNALLQAYEHNKTHADEIMTYHSASDILYHVYEACLKNWFQEEYDEPTEKKYRLDLMEELLLDKGWGPLDVEELTDSPWIMVDRDPQGWLTPTRALNFVDNQQVIKYRTINGVEINHDTGAIQFFMTPWTKDRSVHDKKFTLSDVEDMLARNLGGAIFSLDPVDPYKTYHPFNLMRFSPSQLYGSELLNSMLLTDYMLKFLTTNQEVQGQYPFDQRPVANMISHLPEYLRDIVENFQKSHHSGALHRFWIEAEELNVELTPPVETRPTTRIGLGEINMIVKKHRMELDISGELKDVGNEDEGWAIYVVKHDEIDALLEGRRTITGRAMLYIYAQELIYFWDNNDIIAHHNPKDYQETLAQLFRQPRNAEGKVELSSKNMPLIVRSTQEMTEEAGQPHHFSAEFIFAHEFTTHYDEFALYLPEFGRLKELSKLSVLVNFLDGYKHNNLQSIEALTVILAPTQPTNLLQTSAYQKWATQDAAIREKITQIFKGSNPDFSVGQLKKELRDDFNRMKRQIGTLDFSIYSTEVESCFSDLVDRNVKANQYRFSSSHVRTQLAAERTKIATDLSTHKKDSVRKQLKEIFTQNYIVDAFMQGDIEPAVNARLNEAMKHQFPDHAASVITAAINQDTAAIDRIATSESHKVLNKERQSLRLLEQGFEKIHLGENKEPVDLEDTCLWVPASVRHEVKKDDTTGLTRYSFFVYGGVSIQPKTNIVAGRGPLGGSAVGSGAFNSLNAQAAINHKLSALQKAQTKAVRTEQFPDGRVRYYTAERQSKTPGQTRGNSIVTEHNTKTGQVRMWAESYDHSGKVNRVHPKMIDGQNVKSSHYPPTGAEINKLRGPK